MHKVRRRYGYDIRLGDHTCKSSRLCKHNVPQVLRTRRHQRGAGMRENRAHEFAKHVHDEF
jgi:hypothetical protein